MKKIILCILMMVKKTEISISNKSFDSKNSCQQYFNVESGFYYPSILFFPEYHDNRQDDEKISDCIDVLAKPGDHLLLEVENTGNPVDCGILNSAYKKLNPKLTCFGFDVGFDKNRESYNIYAHRANLLYSMDKVLKGATSAKEIRKQLSDYAEKLMETKTPSHFPVKDYHQKNGKYLKKLCRKLSGLNMKEIEDFLTKENQRLAAKADDFENLSRRGATDGALVKNIKAHQAQLSNPDNSQHLFVVAGARHLDLNINSHLKELSLNEVATLTYTP